MQLPRGKTALLLALKIGVLLGLLAWLLHGLDYRTIGVTLSHFPPQIFALAICLQILTQVTQAGRWKILMGNREIRYLDYLGFVSLGYALALISPSVLLSDSANAWMLGRRTQTVAKSISAMVAGRLMGMVAMGLFFLCALPSHFWVLRRIPWQPRTSFLVGVLVLLLLFAVAYKLRDRFGPKLLSLWENSREVFTRPKALFLGFLLSGGVQMLQMALPWIGYKAMHIPIALTDVLFFMPLITLLALAPVSIGQIGVREGLGIFFFTMIPGVTKEQLLAGFGYGYALFAVMGLLNLGFASLILRKGDKRVSLTGEA